MSDQTYQCTECLLHYKTEELAKQCQDFCSENKACNMEISQQSIESEKVRLIHEN